jgi:hypothetical protein
MAEQLPGELIYQYNLQVTGVTTDGASAFDAVVSGAAGIPRKGPGTTSPGRGLSPASGYEERSPESATSISVPMAALTCHIHAEIATEDDKKIALFAAGVLNFRANSTVGDLRENVTLTTSEHGYAWVNPLQIWALGTVDIATCEVHIAGYAV